MGRVILCAGKTANIPYLLKKPGVYIYSAEELCYCVRAHTFLMDEEVVCKELADWLGEECGLPELADTLHDLLKKKVSTDIFLIEILEYVGYYPVEEIRRLARFLKEGSGRSEYEKRKNIGDYLAGNGKYELAMEQYRRLYADVSDDEAFAAKLLHNMGCVSSRLFLFDSAAELFYRAYTMSGEQESLIQFLAAKRLLLNEKEYVGFIIENREECYEASMELERRMEQTDEAWNGSAQAAKIEDIRGEQAEDPKERRRVREETAAWMKETCRDMVREK